MDPKMGGRQWGFYQRLKIMVVENPKMKKKESHKNQTSSLVESEIGMKLKLKVGDRRIEIEDVVRKHKKQRMMKDFGK